MPEWQNNRMNLIDLLLPRVCRLCDLPINADLDLCPPCWRSLPWNRMPCPRCAAPLPAGSGLCRQCALKPPPFQRTIAPLLFEDAVPGLIHAIKFGKGYSQAKLLSRLLGDAAAAANGPPPCLLVPVPLTTGRILHRGHNQAILLAAPLARRFRIPLERRAVRRVGRTPPQRGQSRAARARSVRGAFEVNRPLTGKVAIVDDVMTTGATTAELARALLEAGADEVVVWAAARVG
ncbi:MAG: ComF family protein [Gammaproteobacteria bacterium]|nr:ComF family protein [Gammaproteobacteria bacterium]